MKANKLHIVCFDVPFPADYGGAVDMFYKIKSLHEAGSEIYLHCYDYGRGRPSELEQYCKHVFYYKRTDSLMGISFTLPYIVASRRDNELLRRLQEIDAPILFEGVHTTYFLSHKSLAGRFKAVRTHNIEHDYYSKLAQKSAFPIKGYYRIEASLLKRYEASMTEANVFLSLSLNDQEYFKALYPAKETCFIPPFHPYDEVKTVPGKGSYCLYHGNLSHPENREAALFLLKEVIPHIDTHFIIAGRNPAADIVKICTALPHCELKINPSKTELDDLVENAHIHVLPTFQESGMKLKLLSALYGGRHVLVNVSMLAGTGLNKACIIAADGTQFIQEIKRLMQLPFTEHDKQLRIGYLTPYDKRTNAVKLLEAMHMGM